MCLRQRQELLGQTRPPQLFADQHGVGNIGHGPSRIHRRLLDPAMSFRLREVELLDEQGLGPVDHFAGFQLALEILVFLADGFEVAKPRDGEVERGAQLLLAERFGQKSEDTGLDGAGDHPGIGSTRQEDQGAGTLGHDLSRRLHAVPVTEADREHRDIRAMEIDQANGILDPAAVAHDLPSLSRHGLGDPGAGGGVIIDDQNSPAGSHGQKNL